MENEHDFALDLGERLIRADTKIAILEKLLEEHLPGWGRNYQALRAAVTKDLEARLCELRTALSADQENLPAKAAHKVIVGFPSAHTPIQ